MTVLTNRSCFPCMQTMLMSFLVLSIACVSPNDDPVPADLASTQMAPEMAAPPAKNDPTGVAACRGGTPDRCGASCVDLQNDARNCGDCGRTCAAPAGAIAKCSNGICTVASEPGDPAPSANSPAGAQPLIPVGPGTDAPSVNGATSDGGIVGQGSAQDTNSSLTPPVTNPPDAGPSCPAAAPDQCDMRCVDFRSDRNNCGACGRVCVFPHGQGVCEGGACKLTTCDQGFADCRKSNPADGCETALGSDNNCGACGMGCDAANASSSCRRAGTSYMCSDLQCEPGWADCNGKREDGCEASLSSRTNCGACGRSCSGATPMCQGRVGSQACTNGCTSAAPDRCGDTCVDLATDESHCGRCMNSCRTRLPASDAFTCRSQKCERNVVVNNGTAANQCNDMHCCPSGTAIVSLNDGSNTFWCSPVVPPGQEECYIDRAGGIFTQRNGMHACAQGYWVRGMRADRNELTCCRASGVTLSDEQVRTGNGCSYQDPAQVVTGVRLDLGQRSCATVRR
jgi:hypothetical protein